MQDYPGSVNRSRIQSGAMVERPGPASNLAIDPAVSELIATGDPATPAAGQPFEDTCDEIGNRISNREGGDDRGAAVTAM